MDRRVMIVLVVAAAATWLPAQSTEDRLRELEAENRWIIERLKASEARNTRLEREISTLRAETAEILEQASDEQLETQVNAISQRLIQQANWTTATKSGLPIRFYGFIRTDIYYNTARMTDPIIPYGVLPEGGKYGTNDSQFAFDSRLTRFGFDLDAGTIGNAEVTGKLETDFANFPSGSTESRETPRIRLAYMNFDFGDVAIRLGQDWDVISPLYPAVHAELLLWGAGNLGDRRPMAQLLWEAGDPAGTLFTFEIAAAFPGAVDGADNDGAGGRTNLDGVNGGLPMGQVRLGVAFDSWVEGKRATLGVWGHASRLRTDKEYNGEDDFAAWSVGTDLVMPLFGPLSLRGEVWYAQAPSDVRGAILQDINTATGQKIQSWGGWAELHWQVSEVFRLALGGSIDNPDSDDLNFAVAGENRDLNWTLYLSSICSWGGGLVSGLDVIYWETQWWGEGVGNAFRINFWTALNF